MKKVTIGGVPEHFNLPWHLAIENNKFYNQNINLQWKDFPGGTGAMCAALRDGSIDVAVILTEGIIKDIIDGNPSQIVNIYVDSPLLWGIHVSAKSKFTSATELKNTRTAISRYGSGSHLMAQVNAVQQGFDLEKLEYVTVKNLEGGVKALTEGTADYFMWEHFMTKPYVDRGIFKRIESIETPWPCFVIAVRNEVLEKNQEVIKTIITVINNQLKQFENAVNDQELIALFAERYQLKTEDVKKWLSLTKWNKKNTIDSKIIDNIQNKLKLFNVIKTTMSVKTLTKELY